MRPLLLLLLPLVVCSERVIVKNTELRVSESHAPVLAADASLVHTKVPGSCGWDRVKECYGLLGLEFPRPCAWAPGACAPPPGACGAGEGARILLHRSQDLAMGYWQPPLELVITARPQGAYRRPQLAFNAATGRWVLWARRTTQGGASSFVAAESPSLEAPFSVVAGELLGPDAGGGSLFVDGALAYLLHAPRGAGGGAAVVERLNGAWTEPGGGAGDRSAPVGPGGTDVPLMARAGGRYYLLLGQACCFCAGGSDTLAFAGGSPLGPFAPAGRLGVVAGAQASFLFAHEAVEGLLWGGHRWGARTQGREHAAALAAAAGAPAPEGGAEAVEAEGYLQVWSLLQFYSDGGGEQPPALRPMEWEDYFRIQA